MTYDLAEMLDALTFPDLMSTVEFDFDEAGRLTRPGTPTDAEHTFEYDATTGEVKEVASSGGVVTRYLTDGPLLDSVEWSDEGLRVGTVGYEYEEARFRQASVWVSGGSGAMSIDYRYDGDGLIEYAGQMALVRDAQSGRVKKKLLGTAGVAMSYDATYGELSEIRTATTDEDPILKIIYMDRDDLGRITTKVEEHRPIQVEPPEVIETQYGYDLRGRLETVKLREFGTGPWVNEMTYVYDANGNRTQATTVTSQGTTTQNYKYAADDRLLCMSDGTNLSLFEYTGSGSLSKKTVMTTADTCATVPAPTCEANPCETTTYDYDAWGNLLGVMLPNGSTIDYEVDAAGRRIAKWVNGVLVKRWLWDGQLRPIAELNPDGSIESLFVYSDGVNSPVYMIRDDVAYTFVKDHLGSVRLVLDSRNGDIVQQVSYDAWGVPTSSVGGLGFQPFGFAGGLYDADTGLVRFGARDYSSTTGRWTAKDPIRFQGGQSNIYVYVGNDAINGVDPSGHAILINNTGSPVVVSGNIGGGSGSGPQSWGVIPDKATGGGAANPIVAYGSRADALSGKNPIGHITDVDYYDNPCGPHRSSTEADNKVSGDDLGPTNELTLDWSGDIDVDVDMSEYIEAVGRRAKKKWDAWW